MSGADVVGLALVLTSGAVLWLAGFATARALARRPIPVDLHDLDPDDGAGLA